MKATVKNTIIEKINELTAMFAIGTSNGIEVTYRAKKTDKCYINEEGKASFTGRCPQDAILEIIADATTEVVEEATEEMYEQLNAASRASELEDFCDANDLFIIIDNKDMIVIESEDSYFVDLRAGLGFGSYPKDAFSIEEAIANQAGEPEEVKYNVVFNDETDSNDKGFKESLEYCKNWIEFNREDKSTYFGDYVGGTVSIVNIETGEEVYTELIK